MYIKVRIQPDFRAKISMLKTITHVFIYLWQINWRCPKKMHGHICISKFVIQPEFRSRWNWHILCIRLCVKCCSIFFWIYQGIFKLCEICTQFVGTLCHYILIGISKLVIQPEFRSRWNWHILCIRLCVKCCSIFFWIYQGIFKLCEICTSIFF